MALPLDPASAIAALQARAVLHVLALQQREFLSRVVVYLALMRCLELEKATSRGSGYSQSDWRSS